jgi:hypothetical protein
MFMREPPPFPKFISPIGIGVDYVVRFVVLALYLGAFVTLFVVVPPGYLELEPGDLSVVYPSSTFWRLPPLAKACPPKEVTPL